VAPNRSKPAARRPAARITARPARQAVERTTPAAGPPASATRRGAAWTLTASFHDRDRISYPELLDEAPQLSRRGGPLLEIYEVGLHPALGEETQRLPGVRAFLDAEDLDFHGRELYIGWSFERSKNHQATLLRSF